MVNLSLTPSESEARSQAMAFAIKLLSKAKPSYISVANDGISRFKSIRPLFTAAVQLGVIKAMIPKALGGDSSTLFQSCLRTEEMFSVEPSFSLNLMTDSLGLMPLFFCQTRSKKDLIRQIIDPFLSCKGSPLASLVSSEPTGSANHFERGGKGLQTFLERDSTSADLILSGEKIWAGNSAGWDEKGADLQTLTCKELETNEFMIILLTREVLDSNPEGSFSIVKHIITPGFTTNSGSHIKFERVKIPEKFVLATGDEAKKLIEMSFTSTAVMVGAMSVGIMRSAFDFSLKWAKEKDMGGCRKIIERQSVADLLIGVKIQIETARLLTWKAAKAIDEGLVNADELAYEAKIYGSETALKVIPECMRVVGISSYSSSQPFVQLMEDAMALPIFDGGNQGIRRRQIQAIFEKEDYHPWSSTFSTDSAQNGNGS